MRTIPLYLLIATASIFVSADEMNFPTLDSVEIEGAPTLQDPFLVYGGDAPIRTEKHGLAAPALWDWDGDGLRDLLVGEFETNSGELFPMGEDGSTVRVYKNIGTNEEPKFSANFEWARDTAGTVMEVPQWCCIGFTPYFYDLDDDGFKDIITGQYHPGEVTWFRGSEDGFLPGTKLPQEGDPTSDWNPFHGGESPDELETFDYWVYSSASMGDFDDDGDFDLIFGGGGGLRMSENIGTKKEPRFGPRELLLDIHGNPLKVRDKPLFEPVPGSSSSLPNPAGDVKTSPYVVDWDDDGVLDLMVTDSYTHPDSRAISFFRGVKTPDGHRFEPGIDLLPAKDGKKALPGSGQRIYVDDWNNDGIKDLIIGASVATVNDGEFSDELSWEWESVNKVESAGKDPGRYPPRERPTKESMLEIYGGLENYPGTEEDLEEMVQFNIEYWDDTIGKLYEQNKGYWLTMRHQGRIYVMLGASPPVNPSVLQTTDDDPVKEGTSFQNPAPVPEIYPVTFDLYVPDSMKPNQQGEVALNIELAPGWYIYAPTGRNEPFGMKETQVQISLPESIQEMGGVRMPVHQFKGLYDVYMGPHVTVSQRFSTEGTESDTYQISAEVSFQTCKDDYCLPPRTETLTAFVGVDDDS